MLVLDKLLEDLQFGLGLQFFPLDDHLHLLAKHFQLNLLLLHLVNFVDQLLKLWVVHQAILLYFIEELSAVVYFFLVLLDQFNHSAYSATIDTVYGVLLLVLEGSHQLVQEGLVLVLSFMAFLFLIEELLHVLFEELLVLHQVLVERRVLGEVVLYQQHRPLHGLLVEFLALHISAANSRHCNNHKAHHE